MKKLDLSKPADREKDIENHAVAIAESLGCSKASSPFVRLRTCGPNRICKQNPKIAMS